MFRASVRTAAELRLFLVEGLGEDLHSIHPLILVRVGELNSSRAISSQAEMLLTGVCRCAAK